MFEKLIGRYGEALTARELKLVDLFGRKGKILRNVYIPKDNGETSEIDVLYITQKGIFVIESKNYSGWIFGDEKQGYWTAMLPNKEKNRFYNPIKQNRTHIKWLREYISDDTVPLFSLIVFSERCELKKITVTDEDIPVIKRDRVYATVRNIWDSSEDTISEEGINALFEKLKPLTKVSRQVKKEHVEQIHERFSDPQDSSASDGSKICPRCGQQLVLRTAKKGANAGNQFWGCSAFPKCRYIMNVE